MTREEAIKIVRENMHLSYDEGNIFKALQTLVPELRESEDERARKWLVDLVENLGEPADEEAEKELEVMRPLALAYLEKQKEHFRDVTKMMEKQNYSGLNDLERAIHRGFLSAGVENVPVTIIKETAKECLAQMKPAEWSEEDERMRNQLICDVKYHKKEGLISAKQNKATKALYNGIEKCYDEKIAWLKSLRPQHHKEIYQAAKRDLTIKFMNYLDENRPAGKMSLSNGECEDIDKAFKENDWAKIIRYIEKYQPHWKPSNEQINYLGAAVIEAQRRHNESTDGFPRYRVLKELYEQLLKL